jgi:putative resolvase
MRVYPQAEIITDIASGLNYHRKGLKALLGRSMSGDKLTIVVAHKDRIARFGVELIEWVLQSNGSQLLVLNQSISDKWSVSKIHILTMVICSMH